MQQINQGGLILGWDGRWVKFTEVIEHLGYVPKHFNTSE